MSSSDDCPDINGSPGGQSAIIYVDLSFQLVDAGFTGDEAFDLVEIVLETDALTPQFEGGSVNILIIDENDFPIAEPLPERLPVNRTF